MHPYETWTFEHEGREFIAELHHDSDLGAPWDEHDGHGPVSEWTRRDKRPGEMVLNEERGSKRFYDFEEATRIAKRDGWGLCEEERAKLAKRLGRAPTAKEVTRESVMQDFDRLRRWCNDDWHWCGVVVRLADDEGAGPDASLWGIESDAGDYLAEVARELAEEVLAEDRKTDAAIAAAIAEVAKAAVGLSDPAARGNQT